MCSSVNMKCKSDFHANRTALSHFFQLWFLAVLLSTSKLWSSGKLCLNVFCMSSSDWTFQISNDVPLLLFCAHDKCCGVVKSVFIDPNDAETRTWPRCIDSAFRLICYSFPWHLNHMNQVVTIKWDHSSRCQSLSTNPWPTQDQYYSTGFWLHLIYSHFSTLKRTWMGMDTTTPSVMAVLVWPRNHNRNISKWCHIRESWWDLLQEHSLDPETCKSSQYFSNKPRITFSLMSLHVSALWSGPSSFVFDC